VLLVGGKGNSMVREVLNITAKRQSLMKVEKPSCSHAKGTKAIKTATSGYLHCLKVLALQIAGVYYFIQQLLWQNYRVQFLMHYLHGSRILSFLLRALGCTDITSRLKIINLKKE